MVEEGSEHRIVAVSAGGENDEAMRLMAEELAQLKLDAEQEKSERDKEKGLLVAKHKIEKEELIATYEENEAMVREEFEGSIANEKEEKEKVEGLRRELAVATEPIVLDLVQAYDASLEAISKRAAIAPLLDLYEHLMSSSISDEKLRREIKCVADKSGNTVLHIAALHIFPHATFSRLVRCGCNINAKNILGETAIITAANNNALASFESLALLGADLSDGKGSSAILHLSESSSDLTYLCHRHGLKKGEVIPAGFVSPLKRKKSSVVELHNMTIANLALASQRCIRIISLEMNQLRVEAREDDEKVWCPLLQAAAENSPLRVLKRLQAAYPAGVNSQTVVNGSSPLLTAVGFRFVECVDLLLEMGSCPAIRRRNDGRNAFDFTDAGSHFDGVFEDESSRLAIIAIFEKHGVTSNVIPENYISPLYFESIYFSQRVADANWVQHGTILMCMQEIDVEYRKFGDAALNHLSKDAKCFFKVFACVDGTDRLGNGIARILLAYIGGENMREKLTREPFLDPQV
jgi:ankyrin repeat protein